jgi:hypothetical protein
MCDCRVLFIVTLQCVTYESADRQERTTEIVGFKSRAIPRKRKRTRQFTKLGCGGLSDDWLAVPAPKR